MDQQPPEEQDSYFSAEAAFFVGCLLFIGIIVGTQTHQWMWSFALSGIYGVAYQLTRLYDRL